MARVNNEEELGKALENDEMTIEIENPVLGKIVVKIKKAGKVKWVVAIGAIAATIIAVVLMAPALAAPPLRNCSSSLSSYNRSGCCINSWSCSHNRSYKNLPEKQEHGSTKETT